MQVSQVESTNGFEIDDDIGNAITMTKGKCFPITSTPPATHLICIQLSPHIQHTNNITVYHSTHLLELSGGGGEGLRARSVGSVSVAAPPTTIGSAGAGGGGGGGGDCSGVKVGCKQKVSDMNMSEQRDFSMHIQGRRFYIHNMMKMKQKCNLPLELRCWVPFFTSDPLSLVVTPPLAPLAPLALLRVVALLLSLLVLLLLPLVPLLLGVVGTLAGLLPCVLSSVSLFLPLLK